MLSFPIELNKENFCFQCKVMSFAPDFSKPVHEDLQSIGLSFNRYKKNLQNFKTSIKRASHRVMQEKISELNSLETQILAKMNEWRNEMKSQMKSPEINTSTQSGQIYANLLKKKTLSKEKLVHTPETIPDDIKQKVSESCNYDFFSLDSLLQQPRLDLFLSITPNSLVRIDLDSRSQKHIPVHFLSNGHWVKGASWVEFKSGMFLYCGGEGFLSIINRCWIIDTDSALVSETLKFCGMKNHRLECVKDYVLAFGGNTTKCQKYNWKQFTNPKWENIADLPAKMEVATSIELNNIIYISGHSTSRVYGYSFDSNKYSVMSDLFTKNSGKLIFKYKDNFLYFCDQKVYKSNDCSRWSILDVKRVDIKVYRILGHAKEIENFIYFVTDDNFLCRFDVFSLDFYKISIGSLNNI